MRIFAGLVAALTIGNFCAAEDLVTTKGEVFKDVHVSRVEPTALVVTTRYGILRFSFEELPKQIQQKYGYVPQAAVAQSPSTAASTPTTPKQLSSPSLATQTTSVATPAASTQTTAPSVAENGSYYGEPNKYGVPKTVHVNGYYRKDGTYVRGYYRSRPHRH